MRLQRISPRRRESQKRPHPRAALAALRFCNGALKGVAPKLVYQLLVLTIAALRLIRRYNCDQASCAVDVGEMCDGRDGDNDGIADEGCLDDRCSELDKDPNPLRFTSGRIETRPLTILALRRKLLRSSLACGSGGGSHLGNSAPCRSQWIRLRFENQAIDYYGEGWMSNYSDRLFIHRPLAGQSIPSLPPTIRWQSFGMSPAFLGAPTAQSGYTSYKHAVARL